MYKCTSLLPFTFLSRYTMTLSLFFSGLYQLSGCFRNNSTLLPSLSLEMLMQMQCFYGKKDSFILLSHEKKKKERSISALTNFQPGVTCIQFSFNFLSSSDLFMRWIHFIEWFNSIHCPGSFISFHGTTCQHSS